MSGTAIIVGECIDIISGSFQGSDGEVKKMEVLVKGGATSDPVEIVAFGKTAERFEEAGMKFSQITCVCEVKPRQYTNDQGRTFRSVNLVLRSWDTCNCTSNTNKEAEIAAPF